MANMEEMGTWIAEVRLMRKDLQRYGIEFAKNGLPEGPWTYDLIEQTDLDPDVDIGMVVLRFQRKYPDSPK